MAIAVIVNEAAPNTPFYTPRQLVPAGTPISVKDGKTMPKIFQSLKIRGVEFPNRIFVSPMCQYSAKDGFITPWHKAHLGGIFTRGPGLTFTEVLAVVPEGRITPEDAGIWSDAHRDAWKDVVDFAHSQSQKIGMQFGHAGRKASTVAPWLSIGTAREEANGWPDNVWGPSAVPFSPDYPPVKELTTEGIKSIIKAHGDAARRGVEAGFDVVEIHGGHGYLVSSFLSPYANKRTDEYGGSFENRIRILLEIIDEVRGVIPENTPLFVRISGTDWLENADYPSWRKEDTARLAPLLIGRGVDLLDVSAGGNHPHPHVVRTEAAYQAPFAQAAKQAVGDKLLIGSVGSITTGAIAEGVLQDGKADVVFVARAFQKNPGLVWAWGDELGVQVQMPNQIRWGFEGRGGKSTAKK